MLGVVPYLVSLATGNAWVMLFGLVFTVADGGDALILLKKLGTSSEGLFTEVPRETVWKLLRTGQTPHHEACHRRVDECLPGGA
jgi:hypothetical protein